MFAPLWEPTGRALSPFPGNGKLGSVLLPSRIMKNNSLTSKAHGWAAARIAAITEVMFGMAVVRGVVLLFSVL